MGEEEWFRTTLDFGDAGRMAEYWSISEKGAADRCAEFVERELVKSVDSVGWFVSGELLSYFAYEARLSGEVVRFGSRFRELWQWFEVSGSGEVTGDRLEALKYELLVAGV